MQHVVGGHVLLGLSDQAFGASAGCAGAMHEREEALFARDASFHEHLGQLETSSADEWGIAKDVLFVGEFADDHDFGLFWPGRLDHRVRG